MQNKTPARNIERAFSLCPAILFVRRRYAYDTESAERVPYSAAELS
ncbi:MAG: hypothetical protein M3494_14365 [Actinomycetota bacterium]|nr:hypothetical protein [Rubrobacter sp.]MDQ3509172.1 hypothetical protein [Actinomycetota bacterium]